MASIGEMASKGQQKLANKSGSMASSWQAAKGRMSQNYASCGFGPTRVKNFQAGVASAQYRTPDPGKWARNWAAKMAE